METPTSPTTLIKAAIYDSSRINEILVETFVPQILDLSNLVLKTFLQSGRVFFIGNGGSAAEAQHIATEFIVRIKHERRALPAIALTADTSVLTATGNDFSFESIFSRQIEALAEKRDLLVALSTSGSSVNVINAIKQASLQGVSTVGFTGNRNGEIVSLADYSFKVPSANTQRIQEVHLLIWHIICELVDDAISSEKTTIV